MDFGVWMHERRIKRSMSQQRLADKVGVHINSIRRWEQGEQTPTFDMAQDIARALGQEITINRREE